MPIRKDSLEVGNIAHVLNKGPRGAEIVFSESEKWRFLKLLYYLNDTNNRKSHWEHSLQNASVNFLEWPKSWEPRKPIVSILCFCLLDNHYHLLLKEVQKGGTSEFIRRLSNSMTQYYHLKHDANGPLFQHTHKRKRVDDDNYLTYLAVYIMVKNTFEMYPDGLHAAIEEFDVAWKWALEYPFSSLADYVSTRNSPIVDSNEPLMQFAKRNDFKKLARSLMEWKGKQLAVDETMIDYAIE